MTRVLVVAPTPMMRAGLRAMLTTSEIEVVGETASLLELAQRPIDTDVLVLTDSALVVETARSVAGDGDISLIAVSEDNKPAAALSELPLRAWGIVSPEAPSEELTSSG